MTSPPRYDEFDRRWPDFAGGREIALPDSQAWSFYEPRPCRQPMAMVRGQVPVLAPGWNFGPNVPPDIDAVLSGRLARILRKYGKATEDGDRASALIEAAWFLLARNYNITAAEFGEILGLAAEWPSERQARLGSDLASLVGGVCAMANVLVESGVS